ncbi:GNAT family N-acetyltransferase [Konateibacter massiliensis]|uniref:GNAT family N-acetyltransferase n=1 Tax=Konateibacter massiliensis TaxID=2002841 RepID=UPI000C148173|nr:GNAT family N-acetyltransferase [Konateibacter massiliensis]
MVKVTTCTEQIEHIFNNWSETLIWSCLQGVMGSLYVNNTENPVSAMAVLGDFCFLAGVPDENLGKFKPEEFDRNFMIMVPQNEAWARIIENAYGHKAKQVTRYAIKKEQDVFDIAKLQEIVESLPPEYKISNIDKELFEQCRVINWCKDWVLQYSDYEMFKNLGLGVVILKDGEPVSGVSAYSAYREGIEIEIDTKAEYRRLGLAKICGAQLILECLKRDLYPSWDAQNKGSVALAEKLGYHYDHDYQAYEIYFK